MKNNLESEFYEDSDNKYIQQGDILFTEILNEKISLIEKTSLSETVYPYFFSNYKFCVVLNATCDLIHTGKRNAKVDCIQLIALYPLAKTLENLITSYSDSNLKSFTEKTSLKIIPFKNYERIKDDLRKIIDGQHKTKFFLPQIPFPDLLNNKKNIKEIPWIAKLDVIISLRFKHYDAFIDAKTGVKIKPQRASKLAENTANLFNRIALDDVKEVLGDTTYGEWINSLIREHCTPINDLSYKNALPELIQLSKSSTSQKIDNQYVYEILNKHANAKQDPAEVKILDKIKDILLKNKVNEVTTNTIISSIEKDTDFKNLFKK